MQNPLQARPVHGDQRARDRVLLLIGDAAPDPVAHQDRNQRDRETRCCCHRVGLGERQRSEQAAFLCFQREDGHEGQGDDEQREEQRGAHLLGSFSDHLPALFPHQLAVGMLVLPGLQLLVGVLDHHHGRIDHGAHGNRNPAQRHDVGVDALVAHHQKRHHDPQRQRNDGDQRRTQVPEEQDADHSHHDELLHEFGGEVLDRPLNECAAVVGGDDLHTLRQAALQLAELGFDGLDGFLGILARAQDHHATSHLPLAVEFGDPAPHLRSDLQRCDVAQTHGNPGARHQRDGPEVVQRLEVAAGAHHVLGPGQLQHRSACFLVGTQDGFPDLSLGQPLGCELDRIKHHLVLLDHAAHRRHFRDIGQALEFEFQEPVLQGPQLGEIVLAGAVHQRILVDPADPGGVGAERRFGRGG